MTIKKEFDVKFGATWHCIVGRNFGSFVTHGQCSPSNPPITSTTYSGYCDQQSERLGADRPIAT